MCTPVGAGLHVLGAGPRLVPALLAWGDARVATLHRFGAGEADDRRAKIRKGHHCKCCYQYSYWLVIPIRFGSVPAPGRDDIWAVSGRVGSEW